MEWKSFRVYGVFTSHDSKNAWVFLNTGAEIVGWRKISPATVDGVSNMLQIATAAWANGFMFVFCLMNEADEIVAIQT